MAQDNSALMEQLKNDFKDGWLNPSEQEMAALSDDDKAELAESRYAFLEAIASGKLEIGTADIKKAAEVIKLSSIHDERVRNEPQNSGKWWKIDFQTNKSNWLAAWKRRRQRNSLNQDVKTLNKAEQDYLFQTQELDAKYRRGPGLEPSDLNQFINTVKSDHFNPQSRYFGLSKNNALKDFEKLLGNCLKKGGIDDMEVMLGVVSEMRAQKFALSDALKEATATPKEKKAARQKAEFFDTVYKKIETHHADLRRQYRNDTNKLNQAFLPRQKNLQQNIDAGMKRISRQTDLLENFTLRGRALSKLKAKAPEYAHKDIDDIANVRLEMVINDDAACRDFLKSQGFQDTEIIRMMPKLRDIYQPKKAKDQKDEDEHPDNDQLAGEEELLRNEERQKEEHAAEKDNEAKTEPLTLSDKENPQAETESEQNTPTSFLDMLTQEFGENAYRPLPAEPVNSEDNEQSKELRFENDERKLSIKEENDGGRLVVNGENKNDPEDKRPAVEDFQVILKGLKSKGTSEINIESDDKEYVARALLAAQKEGVTVLNFDRSKDMDDLLKGVSEQTRQQLFETGLSGVPKEKTEQLRSDVDFMKKLREGVNVNTSEEKNKRQENRNPFEVFNESIKDINKKYDNDGEAIDAAMQKMDNLGKLTDMDSQKYKKSKEYKELSDKEKALIDRYHDTKDTDKSPKDVKALGRMLSVYRGTKDTQARRKIVARTLDRSAVQERKNTQQH